MFTVELREATEQQSLHVSFIQVRLTIIFRYLHFATTQNHSFSPFVENLRHAGINLNSAVKKNGKVMEPLFL